MDINKQGLASAKLKPKLAPEMIAGNKQGLPANKMSINLLPPEMLYQRHQSFKLSVVNKLSIASLLVMVFFTSAALAMKVSQKSELQKSQNDVVLAENKVSGLKIKESQLLTLKERLKSIKSLMGGDSKRKAVFNMIVLLTPENLQVIDASVDKNGYMTIGFNSTSVSAIEALIQNLGDKEKNSNLIARVELDGLSMDKARIFRFNLRIVPK